MGKPTPGFSRRGGRRGQRGSATDRKARSPSRPSPSVRSACSPGYWRDEQTTRNSYCGKWYLTGDKAYVDRGRLLLVHRPQRRHHHHLRLSRRPLRGRDALIEHPAVLEAAAVASPDAVRGEVVKAFVRLAPGYEPSEHLVLELQHHVREITRPTSIRARSSFVKDLPKTDQPAKSAAASSRNASGNT